MTNSSVELSTDARLEAVSFGWNPDMDFKRLVAEATHVEAGFQLIEKDLLCPPRDNPKLSGIPHIIIGVTYREGFPQDGRVGDYVSIEAVLASEDVLQTLLKKHLITEDQYESVIPNSAVVYNDGGTGIRRTLTKYFSDAGIIKMPKMKNAEDDPFDTPFQFWEDGSEIAEQGIVSVGDKPLRHLVTRGLRVSEYKWNDQPAETYYFA